MLRYQPQRPAERPPRNVGRVFTLAIAAAVLGAVAFAWLAQGTALGEPALWILCYVGGASVFVVLIACLFGRTPAQAAREIHRQNRAIYAGAHERRFVDEREIAAAGLDRAFYGAATAALERLGFRQIGDVVDVTLQAAMPGYRSVVRGFLGRDGTVIGAAYHLRVPFALRVLTRLGLATPIPPSVEFETEFDDGTFASTSTAESAAQAPEFPGLSRRFLPTGTPPVDLLAEHERHVAELIAAGAAAGAAIAPLAFADATACLASAERLDELKARHRRSPEYDPAEFIANVAGRELTTAERSLADEARRLHFEHAVPEAQKHRG